MKKEKSLFFAVGSCFIVTTVLFLWNPLTIGASETCTVVTIHGRSGLNARTLAISKGSCVVWMNWTRNEDVTLSFKEGEKCMKVTKSGVGFKLDAPM